MFIMDEPTSDEERLMNEFSSEKPHSAKSTRLLKILELTTLSLVVMTVGFLLGRWTGKQQPMLDPFPRAATSVPISEVETTFERDERFLAAPPAHGEPEPVWDSILPPGLGFVRNPDTDRSPSILTVSGMHQLHCLYTLRRILYAESSGEKETQSFDNGVDRPSHVAHCFDYLRQSIMCSSDSTLEPFEASHKGFPGMGFPRRCKDYSELKQWAAQRRAFDLNGFIQAALQHNMSGVL